MTDSAPGKVIRCEAGFVVRGRTDDELIETAQAHVRSDHPELVGQINREDWLQMAEDA